MPSTAESVVLVRAFGKCASKLHQLGYSQDGFGNPMDVHPFEEALLETCEEILKRTPMSPENWTPEVLV